MTDLELLEAAAKATCLIKRGEILNGDDDLIGLNVNTKPGERSFRWAPLADDGDALRLAITLGLTVETNCRDSDVAAYLPGRVRVAAVEWSGLDPAAKPAAVRRAIVRAAAAMAVGDA